MDSNHVCTDHDRIRRETYESPEIVSVVRLHELVHGASGQQSDGDNFLPL